MHGTHGVGGPFAYKHGASAPCLKFKSDRIETKLAPPRSSPPTNLPPLAFPLNPPFSFLFSRSKSSQPRGVLETLGVQLCIKSWCVALLRQFAIGAMDAGWKQELEDRGIHHDVIAFFASERITSPSRFANYIDRRDEIETLIVNKVPAVSGSRSEKTLLTELWRELDQAETLRLSRKANGVEQDDLENPLDSSVIQSLHDRFFAKYSFRLSLKELLCEPLLGRLRREFERRSHSLITLERVRTAR